MSAEPFSLEPFVGATASGAGGALALAATAVATAIAAEGEVDALVDGGTTPGAATVATETACGACAGFSATGASDFLSQ